MDKFEKFCYLFAFIATLVAFAYAYHLPPTEGNEAIKCGNACISKPGGAMLSYSKEQGCVCLHQGPL